MIDDWNDDNESIQVYATIAILKILNFFLMLKELLMKFEFSVKVLRGFEELKRRSRCISEFESLWSVDFIVNRRFAYRMGEYLEFFFSSLYHNSFLEFLYNWSELVYFWYEKSFWMWMFNFRYDIKIEEDKNIYLCYYFFIKVLVSLKNILTLNCYVYCYIV